MPSLSNSFTRVLLVYFYTSPPGNGEISANLTRGYLSPGLLPNGILLGHYSVRSTSSDIPFASHFPSPHILSLVPLSLALAYKGENHAKNSCKAACPRTTTSIFYRDADARELHIEV
jgi:hypothetical protein